MAKGSRCHRKRYRRSKINKTARRKPGITAKREQMETLTENQIERRVELAIDRLDRHLLSNQITQEQYDRDIAAIDKWAAQQYQNLKAI